MKKSWIRRSQKPLKRTPLKRGTSQLKRTPLNRGIVQLKRTPLKQYAKLKMRGTSETSVIKEEIQSLCRAVAIKRDKVCVLSHYPEAGECGGYRNDGELIVQYDHLHSRVHSVSFGDTRLGVLLCKRHHIFWKKQYPDLFMKIVRQHIGEERSALLDRVQADRKAHKMDWQLVKLGLLQELRDLPES